MSQKTYHIITIGCQMNENDSERVASFLEELGYAKSSDPYTAEVVVATTCGVRQSAENRVYGLMPRIKEANPNSKIVITGCLSNREDVRKRLENSVDIWLPITELPSLAGKLGCEKQAGDSLSGYFQIQPKYESAFSAYVPIGNGCNNFCSYCVVPYARGREEYRPAEEIINEVKKLLEKGYKEITLIAQNVNSYISNSPLIKGLPAQAGVRGIVKDEERVINFAQLLRMANDLPGDFWLRFSTSHPKDMSDELIAAIASSEKVCRHIHLPAQAGDNEILKAMNRKYTVEHYVNLVKKIRLALPGVSVTTDVIVGFPGETSEQFDNTAKLFRELKFDMAYISQYSPRPGTAAAKLEDDITKEEKKRREESVNDILRGTALENNQAYLNAEVEILFDRKKGRNYVGRTKTSKVVRVETNENLIGQIRKVKIISVQDFGMIGEVVC